MGNPNPKTKWKPGQSGNPNGPKPLPPDLQKVKKLSRGFFERLMTKYLELSPAALKKELKKPQARAVDHIIGNIVLKAIEGGDEKKMEFLLNRLIGKVTDKVEIEIPKPFVVEKLEGGVVEAGVAVDAEFIEAKEHYKQLEAKSED